MRSPRRSLLARLLALVPAVGGVLTRKRIENAVVGDGLPGSAGSEAPSYRVAVLTSGVLVRYFLEPTARLLIAPLVAEGHRVDYYLSLNTEAFGAWKGYARMFQYDPAIAGHEQNLTFVEDIFNRTLSEAGAEIRALWLHKNISIVSEPVVNFAMHATGWHQGQGSRTMAARSNVLKLLYQNEMLWGQLLKTEQTHGRYDFVITTRDDTMWMKPFSLNRILGARDHMHFYAEPNRSLPTHDFTGQPHGYHIRCIEASESSYDAVRENGLTEYIFVLRRERADPFGTLFSRLLRSPEYWGEHNLESFLSRVATEERFHFSALPAAMLPLQRAGRVPVNGTITRCLHKACDSATPEVKLLRPLDQHPLCQPIGLIQQLKSWSLPVGMFPSDYQF